MSKQTLVNKQFGRLCVLERAAIVDKRIRYVVRCDCGREFVTRADSLTSGGSRSCGCLQREIATESCKDLIGQRFGRLAVLGKSARRGSNRSTYWKTRCDCGAEQEVRQDSLVAGVSLSCGCFQKEVVQECYRDLTGQQFGRLCVKHKSTSRALNGSVYWVVECVCGIENTVRQDGLISGAVQSCGCLQREHSTNANTTHGLSESNSYSCWVGMIQRCTNQKTNGWKYYGGRGITVCKRWRESFESFYADMGERPNGLTLDRINNNGNYEPGNCRWATWIQQAANKRAKGEAALAGI